MNALTSKQRSFCSSSCCGGCCSSVIDRVHGHLEEKPFTVVVSTPAATGTVLPHAFPAHRREWKGSIRILAFLRCERGLLLEWTIATRRARLSRISVKSRTQLLLVLLGSSHWFEIALPFFFIEKNIFIFSSEDLCESNPWIICGFHQQAIPTWIYLGFHDIFWDNAGRISPRYLV